MQRFVMALNDFLQFDGRSRRSEYWSFMLSHINIFLLLLFLEISLGWVRQDSETGPLTDTLTLIVFLPALAVSTRRLHDTGRSGWWILLAFVPIIGMIGLIVFYATEGEAGTNAYGPNPKEPLQTAFEFPNPINS
jgi:uncharacterized membrane protein YhaH (DUF805 family)